MGSIVVTGASGGIGAAAAVELARQGHEVLAVGRSEAKLADVHERMLRVAPSGVPVPEPVAVDFASLDQVRGLADTVLGWSDRLDALANNAGLSTRQREESVDGYELTFAVNHLAPFLLTNLLAERLVASGGRVVGTTSYGYRFARIDFDDLQLKQNFNGVRAYGQSKLADIWFAMELLGRTGIPATCFNPGSAVSTDLARDSKSAMKMMLNVFGRTPEKGADTLVWLATDPEGAAPRAIYYANRKPVTLSKRVRNHELAAQLWDVSAKLVQL